MRRGAAGDALSLADADRGRADGLSARGAFGGPDGDDLGRAAGTDGAAHRAGGEQRAARRGERSAGVRDARRARGGTETGGDRRSADGEWAFEWQREREGACRPRPRVRFAATAFVGSGFSSAI